MKLSQFDYHLPPELIAQTPSEPRDSAKLLCLSRQNGQIEDKIFRDITEMLTENDVLVVNETKVINARLKGCVSSWVNTKDPVKVRDSSDISSQWLQKPCEIFLHKKTDDEKIWDCLVYPGKKLKPWTQVDFPWSPLSWKIVEISEKWRYIEFSHWWQEFLDLIESIWETPLPPYIKDHSSPPQRYQTVYNNKEKSWSVAAPTAGLHFTPELIHELENKWVIIEKVLLHVGLGTFWNVEVEDIKNHKMHSEYIELTQETTERLNSYKKEGKRIIAVWTTSVRTLESFSDDTWVLSSWNKQTNIFIYPGYEWKYVDALITNFHLPKSTLLMLVSSFAERKNIKKAYSHAIDSQYRFFSFWDAMFIH